MTGAESIAVYNTLAAAFPDAIVSLVVSVDDNNSVTTTGIDPGRSVVRAVSRGGLKDNVDARIYVLRSAFPGVVLDALPNRTAVVTFSDGAVTLRIMSVREIGSKVLVLQFGEYDRVTG